MVFNSFAFFVFLAICLVVYRWLPHRGQNLFLLAASYFFYGAWDWRFLGLILLSTLVDWGVGLGLGATRDPRRRRWLVSASIVTSLGLLGFFKYAGFFAASLARLASLFGVTLSPLDLGIVLPVGISFYTFQTMSYTIDVYRGRDRAGARPARFRGVRLVLPAAGGRTHRAGRVTARRRSQAPRQQTLEKFSTGAWLILWGLFKKVVIADNLGGWSPTVFAEPERIPRAPKCCWRAAPSGARSTATSPATPTSRAARARCSASS